MLPTKPDRRYQVFVSSTFRDLADERKAAIEAIFEAGHIPIALERFTPADEGDLEIINRAMGDSQVYVLILGHRYGELVPGKDISFTELEYDLAQEHGLKTLVFVLDEATVQAKRRALDPNNTRDKAELLNYDALCKFHDRIKRFRQFFMPGPQFKYMVELALVRNLDSWDRPGFIREPSDPNVLAGAQNEFIGDLVSELTSYKKLYLRTQEDREQKKGLSRFFVQKYLDVLFYHKVSLFLEAGTTIAFVAREMHEKLYKKIDIIDDGPASIQISTNNVLAYLLLWLRTRIPCTKFPWGPPVEDTYGGAYGPLFENILEHDPDYHMPPLDESAAREISRLEKSPYTLTSMRRPILLLGVASGLQLSSQPQLRFSGHIEEVRKQQLTEQLSRCKGPHVGSYRDKLFKRFMYATKLPIMIFITDNKIDCEIEVGKCHFILDTEFTWERFYREHPVAFCVGCSTSEASQRHANTFRQLGFEVIEENSAGAVTSFVARNAAFIEQFEKCLMGIARAPTT